VPSVRPATLEDARALAPRLRKADLQEMQALLAQPPETVLTESVRDGTETYSIVADDGSVIGMFGIYHHPLMDPLEAAVWLLGSDALLSIKTDFLRGTLPYLHQFHLKYPFLWNVVDCRNEVHIRWLKRFGFMAIHKHERLGVEQRPFFEFVRIDNSPCVPSPQPV